MSLLTSLDILLTGRASVTDYAIVRRRFTPTDDDMQWTFPEQAAGTLVQEHDTDPPLPTPPVPPTAISLQRVAKARLVVLLSDIPIHLYINSASNDPIAGTFFIQVADTTTGITSLYIKNDIATSGDATVEFFIGGDEATT